MVGPDVQILVVNGADMPMITARLREEGFGVLGAPDEVAAIPLLRTFRPALVIAQYPPSWGPEGSFLAAIRRFVPDARTIAIVDRYDRELAQASLAEGFDDLCSRPLSMHVLLAKVRHRLSSSDERGEPTPPRESPGTGLAP